MPHMNGVGSDDSLPQWMMVYVYQALFTNNLTVKHHWQPQKSQLRNTGTDVNVGEDW